MSHTILLGKVFASWRPSFYCSSFWRSFCGSILLLRLCLSPAEFWDSTLRLLWTTPVSRALICLSPVLTCSHLLSLVLTCSLLLCRLDHSDMSTILEAGAAARMRSMETDMIACVFKKTASFNHSIYIVYSDFPSFPIGSVVLLYMVCHGSHPYTPVMLAYIPAPWIRHGFDIVSHHFPIKGHQPQPASFRVAPWPPWHRNREVVRDAGEVSHEASVLDEGRVKDGRTGEETVPSLGSSWVVYGSLKCWKTKRKWGLIEI